ncbi:hypothetical protein F2Q70_00014956 [Brassica cretica]|uniref:Rab3GAP catalytic subunit conserved domain-containing protein n=1 Tax=Brassica cretica TaxID=69181 RepID=A0A8S9HU93_BRACR|nr:hypothetical protein F2Q70_00014956 [Brassica cretica]
MVSITTLRRDLDHLKNVKDVGFYLIPIATTDEPLSIKLEAFTKDLIEDEVRVGEVVLRVGEDWVEGDEGVGAGKRATTVKDFVASSGSSSPVKERGALSLSAVKSLVLGEKENKVGFDSGDEEKLVSLVNALFNVESNFLIRMIVSDLGSPTRRASFAKDLHAAPPCSFVVKLAEVIGSFTTPRRMALFWCRVVDELRRFWKEEKQIPWIPLDENPDLKSCLLHQWLQVINCCLARKACRVAASEALDAVLRQASSANEESYVSEATGSPVSLLYAKSSTGELILRLGVYHQVENLTMLETGEPVYAPVTQEGPLLTEDLIKETEELVLRRGRLVQLNTYLKSYAIALFYGL